MTSLVIDDNLAGMFRQRVAPVLEARAIAIDGSPVSQLKRLLSDRPRLWGLVWHRPAVGSIAKVQLVRRGMPQIFDSSVHLPGLEKNARGERMVRVRAVFGLTAACEPAPGASEARGPAQSQPLLAITCREVTVVADVMPGKDCLIAVSVWANEMLPLGILLKRPEKLWPLPEDQIDVVAMERDALGFGVACSNCAGTGREACRKCRGTGIHKPRAQCDRCGGKGFRAEMCRNCNGQGQRVESCNGCNGSGQFRATCKKCGGMGMFRGGTCFSCHGSGAHGGPCRRCGGSGRKSFSCRGCNGTGERRWPCGACHERGYFPQQNCDKCEAVGTITCYRCRGTRYLHSRFSTRDGTHGINERSGVHDRTVRMLRPEEVVVLDWRTSQVQPLLAGAGRLIERAIRETGGQRTCDPTREAALHAHCQQFSAVEGCLVRSLEADGVRELGPIRLHAALASLARLRDTVVYEFPVALKKSWVRDGVVPFAEGTPVRFMQSGSDGTLAPVDLVYQARPGAGRPAISPTLAGCRGKGRGYRLQVRFPLQVDISRLPADVILSADTPPRAERTQIRHLRRWCGRENRDHPVLHAVAFGEGANGVHPFDPLAPRQAQALGLGVSGSPLGMIKGPPGTGKTTVITEIVRRLVARGQRVLVCSQTHQAVRNALERLHQQGDLRMMRNGREENLSEIEKRYLEGASDDFPERVLKRSRETLGRLGSRLAILVDAIRRLSLIRDAAAELDEARGRLASASNECEQRFRTEVEAAETLLETQLAKLARDEKAALDPHVIRRRIVQQQFERQQPQIALAQTARDAAEQDYMRKAGRKPQVTQTQASWIQGVRDALLPNWLVSLDALQDRFSRESRRLDELRSAEATHATELAAIDVSIAALQKSRQAQEAVSRAAHAESLKVIESQHATSQAETREKAAEIEIRMRSIRAEAAPVANALGHSLLDDLTAWLQTVLTQVEAERRRDEERATYLSRWVADIEADPRSITSYCWDNVQVFFSTCVGLASWRRLIERERDAVDLVIIDEAAHATAPETIIPMLYSRRALLIGDEMQLPPVMTLDTGDCGSAPCSMLLRKTLPPSPHPTGSLAASVRMSECWLGCSLFEWLWRARPGIPRVMLDTQFRMHPLIADFVGTVFYPEGLSSGVRPEDRAIAFGEFTKPICLIPTSAYPNRYEEFIDPGYRNLLEARIVRRVLERAEAELVEPHEFGIITPYAGQVRQVLHELGEMLLSFQKVKLTEGDVASVDSFQGSERDVIVITFARSPRPCPRCQGKGKRPNGERCRECHAKGWLGTGLTFARDLRRLNVAFSRVRKMLILIGDIDALTDLGFAGRAPSGTGLGNGSPGGQVLARFKKYVEDHGKVLCVWEHQLDER